VSVVNGVRPPRLASVTPRGTRCATAATSTIHVQYTTCSTSLASCRNGSRDSSARRARSSGPLATIRLASRPARPVDG